MNELYKLIVEKSETGERIDKYLGKHFPTYSRSYFQNIIESGNILINGRPAIKSSQPLKENDLITINFPPAETFKLEPRQVDFEIIDTQNDFIIINKPADLIVHHCQNTKDKTTLVHGLLYLFKEFENFKDTERPGIVHRLDKNTSGIIIIAKNIPAQIKLSSLFKERKIKKTYYAIVEGHPSIEGTIDFNIGRHVFERHKMSKGGIEPRPAITHYKVLEYLKDSAVVEINPVTGRTHQIRVHFEGIGHPLIGDETYGKKSKLISRHALHAGKIEFEYNSIQYLYECPLPLDMQDLIETLRQERTK